MENFENLVEQISIYGGEKSELFEIYKRFWRSFPNLNGTQIDEVCSKLKFIDPKSPESNSWRALSEGMRCVFHPEYGNAFDKITHAINLFTQNDDKPGEGAAQALLTIYYKNLGQLDTAQQTVQQSILNINEDESYVNFLSIAYFQAGEIHHILKDYDAAIQLFNKANSLFSGKEKTMSARLFNGIGTVYRDKNEPERAFEFFQKSLKEIEGNNHILLESKNYADIGNYYFRIGNFDQSLFYQQKSLQIRKENKLNNALITNYIELAELFLKQNNLEDALEHALLAEKLSIELNIVIKKYQADLIISTIYEAMGETALALAYYKKYHQTKDEVLGNENARKIKQITMHHELESMQKEKEIFELRNVILKEALDEISASVRYAKRIQEAILPPIGLIKEKLSDVFVLYKPKDVIAGDFYWTEEIGDVLFIAVADCTGHGVPGALVSVVCSNALNRAVKEFQLLETGKILDKVCLLVCETFEKSATDVKDGMDISLLAINKSKKQIQWSGANNPLWYFCDTKMEKLPADKRPIGKSDNLAPFTTHLIDYKANTTFYLFTDGYADQFGGAKGKKFMYNQFQEILSDISKSDVSVQQAKLESTFENWKGELEQVDDVCVIGIKL